MSSADNILNNFHYQGDDQKIVLKPCHICGRTFIPQSLERHEKVCEKSKKCIRRNVFNSFSQRVKELEAIPVSNDAKEEEKPKCRKLKDNDENYKCEVKTRKKDGINGLNQQKKGPPGYQVCPSCNRCFNPKAADRHIAWCTEQHSRLPKTPPNSEALKRLKARIKYQAPIPKKRDYNDVNIRLVRSADTFREPSLKRTHSSPSINIHEARVSRHKNVEDFRVPVIKSAPRQVHKSNIEKSRPVDLANNNVNHQMSPRLQSDGQIKKVVKFKEIFPVPKEDRSLDMLAALKLSLSKLGMSELYNDCFMKSNENGLHRSKSYSNVASSRNIYTNDGEAHSSNGSSSDSSFPVISPNENGEQKIPRFCYNCGTKYPVVSAKYCCECGARRFVFGANNNPILGDFLNK